MRSSYKFYYANICLFLIALLVMVGGVNGAECNSTYSNYIYSDVGSTTRGYNNLYYNITDGSFNFNGNNSYILHPDVNGFNKAHNGSMSVWVNMKGAGDNDVTYILGYNINVRNRMLAKVSTTNFQIQKGNPVSSGIFGSFTYNQWYNLVFTWYTLNSTTGNASLYYNGVNTANITYTDITTDGSNFYVGSIGSSGQFFNGTIDEIRFYNRTITTNEVLAINNSGRKNNDSLNSTGLALYLSFDRNGYLFLYNCSNISLEYLRDNFQNGVVTSSGNVFDLNYGLSIWSYIYPFNITNKVLRMNTANRGSSWIETWNSNEANIINSSIYTYNGTNIENNIYKYRGYINIQNYNKVLILNSNISYLGDSATIASRKVALALRNDSNILLNNSIFSFGVRNIYIKDSNNINVLNNNIFNATVNNTESTANIQLVNSNYFNITNNTVYNAIVSYQGWKLDDSSNIIASNSSYGKIDFNNINNGENGISLYDHVNNVIVNNNLIKDIFGTCLKIENAGYSNSILDNKINHCSITDGINSSLGQGFGAILLDGASAEDSMNNNIVSGNVIYDTYYSIKQWENTYNTTIKNNLLIQNKSNSSFPNSIYIHINSNAILSNNLNLTLSNTNNFSSYLSDSYLYFKNLLIENINITNLRTLSSPLISLSNNTAFITTGDVNITLQPNNYTYVYDNYVLTEGRALTGEPFVFTSSTDTSKVITSSSTNDININISVDKKPGFPCNSIKSVNIDGTDQTIICNDTTETITILNAPLNQGSNLLFLSYTNNPATNNLCSSMFAGFSSFNPWVTAFSLLGIVIIVLIIGGVLLVTNQFGQSENQSFNVSLNGNLFKAFFIMTLVIAILLIISLVVIQNMCSLA